MSATRRLLPSLLVVLALPVLACNSAEHEAALAELQSQVDAAKAETETVVAAKAELATKLEERDARIEALEQRVTEQADEIAALEGDKGSLEGELQKKQAALESVKVLQEKLAKSLVEEIETGDVRVSERHGYLVIDVSDKVLFAVGEAELSERGKKVITKLAESLTGLPEKSVFQVGGHTDNQPIKSEEVKAKFPTNWELSTARATNVVRFLEETCGLPGERLVAAGFSEFRPVASNKKPQNRAKNRRIEIALLPAPR